MAYGKPHTKRPASSGTPELAIARWENEGGGPGLSPKSPSRPHGVTSRRCDPRKTISPPRTDIHDTLTAGGASEKDRLTRRSHVQIGRVYDERRARNDFRVLVDRVWPRGVSKARADVDEWCKMIAPSTALRTWYGHDPDRFVEFERRYRQELQDPDHRVALGHLRELARDRTVILLTATRRPEISEAAVLAHALHSEEQVD